MNTELLNENRAKGWAPVVASTVPEWVKAYVCEFREAVLDKRQMKPNLLRAFLQGCEKRSAMNRSNYLLSFARRRRSATRPGHLTAAQVIAIAARTGQSLEDVRFGKSPKVNEDRWLKDRLAIYGSWIAKDNARRSDDDDDFDDPDDDDNWDWDDDDSEKKHRRSATSHRTLAHKASDCHSAAPHFRAADLHEAAATKRTYLSHIDAQAASRALRKRK